MRSRLRLLWLAVVTMLVAGVLLPTARAASDPNKSPALCGAADTPETGIQGDVPKADQDSGRAAQGYNCGLAMVGQLGFDAPVSSLAWAGNCAYVQRRGGGLVVVDVSRPDAPAKVGELTATDGGSAGGGAENIHAVTAPGRALLVAARARADRTTVFVDVYDVKDCKKPVLKGAIGFPNITTNPQLNPGGPAHNIELNPQGTKVYGSMPLQEADISNLDDPSTWAVRTFQCEVAAQYHPVYTATESARPCDLAMFQPFVPQIAHEFEFNADGTRMYVGGQTTVGGYDEAYLTVLDMTVWPPKVVSRVPGAGHGVRRATLGGQSYLLHSNEVVSPQTATAGVTGSVGRTTGVALPPGVGENATANGCLPEQLAVNGGTAEPYLTDIEDDTKPVTVSHLQLAINKVANCAAQVESQVNSTVHYNTLDDPDDTHFAMLSMKNAGLRVWDVRNPTAPTEVGYFNPGQYTNTEGSKVLERVRMHTYYDKSSGHLWLLSENGGFWVLELEPQVRAALGLPLKRATYPTGRPARPPTLAVRLVAPIVVRPEDLTSYCSL